MNNSTRDSELVQKYFDRSLNDEEKHELEYRLKEEPGLQSLFNEHRRLISGIKYSHLKRKLEQLRAIEASKEWQKAAPKRTNIIKLYWKPLAAAATLALAVTSYLLMSQPDAEDLYTLYFEPYPNVFEPTQRSSEGQQGKRADAFQSYDNGNYELASELFGALLAEKQEPEILLLLGNTNLMLNKDEEAKNNFLTLIKDFEGLDEQAKWYLSLCYLKQGEKEKASLILEELEDPKVAYSRKAKQLLKEVK